MPWGPFRQHHRRCRVIYDENTANCGAAEAVETYVDRELAIIEGIERGLADVEAGRTVSHEDAMASLRQVIDDAVSNTA